MSPIVLEGAPNFRDLGGHRATDGQIVRRGLVFRSGHLANLTEDDLQLLVGIGTKTIVDFRPQTEREMTGHDRIPDGAEYVAFPIGDPNTAPHVKVALERGDFTVLPDLAVANRTLVRDFAKELGSLLELASEPANLPLVFHCIGGKDRTGMAAALLLSILGVPWDAVRADYLSSNGRLGNTAPEQQAFLDRVTSSYTDTTLTDANRNALRQFFVLEPGYIEAAHDEILQIAGSFKSYVSNWLGLSDVVVSRLRTTLLEPAGATT